MILPSCVSAKGITSISQQKVQIPFEATVSMSNNYSKKLITTKKIKGVLNGFRISDV
jgi:uncharacterized membrane protein